LFGPPGTGKTLCARAVANRTDACFIRVIGSELVQKYVGEVKLNAKKTDYSKHKQARIIYMNNLYLQLYSFAGC